LTLEKGASTKITYSLIIYINIFYSLEKGAGTPYRRVRSQKSPASICFLIFWEVEGPFFRLGGSQVGNPWYMPLIVWNLSGPTLVLHHWFAFQITCISMTHLLSSSWAVLWLIWNLVILWF